MKTIPQPAPQCIMIFVPNFNTQRIAMRQIILADDWVAQCYELDEKYKIWYTVVSSAQMILNLPINNEI